MSPLDGFEWLVPWGNDGWSPPVVDTREMIGGPLDGDLWRTLSPLANIARYYPNADGDFVYVPPFVPDAMVVPESPAVLMVQAIVLGMLACVFFSLL